MAIHIRILDEEIEAGLLALRDRQPVRVSLAALGEAIITRAVAACIDNPVAWMNPEAWMNIGKVVTPDDLARRDPGTPTPPVPGT